MKKFTQRLRSHPARTYLALFLLMILPALGLFPLARSGNQIGIGFFLVLIILANIGTIIF
jgi:hypothetical protein